MKRRISVLFVFMLIFQTLTSSFAFPAQMNAAGSKESFIKDITFLNEAGEELDEENLEGSTNVTVIVDWSVENMNVEDGSSETIGLPSALNIHGEQTGALVNGNVEVGTYTATVNGALTVTFNEAVVEYPEANGEFTFKAEAEAEEQEELANEALEEAETANDKEEQRNTESEAASDVAEDKEVEVTDEGTEKVITKEDADADAEAAEDADSSTASKVAVQEDGGKYGFYFVIGGITDIDGNPYDDQNPIHPQEEFWLKLDWYLENAHNYVAGDKEIFDLPAGIKIIEEMTGELRDASNQIVATYKITTDNKVELIFTEFVETHSNVSGYLEVLSSLDLENADYEDGEIVIHPINDEDEIRIPIDLGERYKTIEKGGTPNKGYNADEINWSVIINKHQQPLKNAFLTDELPEGTEFKEGSLKVTRLIVDLYGNILGDAEEVDVIGENVDNGRLTIPLGDIRDAYRIEYVTHVTDDEKREFRNDVTLSDDEMEDVSANATVTIKRGEAIKKKAAKGYNPKTGIIEWEIEFNYNEKNLNDVTLTDAWTPAGKLELVEDSLVFIEVEIDENGSAHETGEVGLPEGAILVPVKDGFEVRGISTDKAYKVIYQTKVIDRVLESFEVANTAGFGGETANSGAGIDTYYGSKSAGTVNYAAKTIDWRIEINHDEYPMENISVLDTLGAGLILIEDSIHITVGGKQYTGFTVTGSNPFEIKFPETYITNEKIIITYQTNFIADELPDNWAKNNAAITWTPEGGNESITKEVDAATELNWQTAQSDWKNGSYNPASKEITWSIYTNYRENQFENLIITDAPQGNQKILADSVVVKELAIGENGNITEGEPLKADVVSVDETANTLQVTIGKTNKAYKIEYRTSLNGLSDIQKEYVNKAEVLDGTESRSELEAKVGIKKSDTYGEKSGYQEGKQVHWSVKVNLGQQKINNLKLEDTISANQDYLADTFKVYHATVDVNGTASKGEEVAPEDYILTHTKGAQTFTVEWQNEVDRPFIVEYSTLFFEKHNGEVTNTYKITGDHIVKDGHTDGGGSVIIRQTSSGGGSGEAGYLIIDKINTTDGGNEKLAGAVFELIDADTGKVLKTGTTDQNGQIDFGRLLFGDYVLFERVVPDGFVTREERQTITIDEIYDPQAEKIEYAYTVENYEPVFAIELEKVDDLGAILPGVTFELYNSSDELIAAETTNEEGKILFADLKAAGKYYLVETGGPIGYEPGEGRYYVEVGSKEREPVSARVVNQRELVGVSGTKHWDDKDNQDGIRPEVITVNLLADGEIIQSADVTAANNWNYQFINLPKYKNEKEITYTVAEVEVNVEGYTSEVDGFDIINSYTPEVIDISGTKRWEDANNQDGVRPDSVIVNLLANGTPVAYKEVSADDNWEYSFKDLPKYEAGEAISYTVTEDTVDHYSQSIDGFDITNSYTPEVTAATVTKHWDDANNQDGIRPENIKVQLTADGERIGNPVELSEENAWTHTWGELPLNKKGKAIEYSVVELTELPGYETTVNDKNHGNIIITNSYIPAEIDISGEKTWIDADNQDGIRPESITVNLLADDEQVRTEIVTAEDNWKYNFTGLPKYKDGNEIVYTITEETVEGYGTVIHAFDITNKHEPEVTEVSGEKIWDDANNQDGVRPDSITVNLLADGEQVDSKEVTETEEWKYSFTDLPKYNNGVEIVYTITENKVDEYTAEIDGMNVINHHTPGQTGVTVTKHWDDANNQDGIRPESIEVQLTADGEVYGDPVELSEENNWTHIWMELDEKAAGKAIAYSVIELTEVPKYKTTVNDADHGNIIITNAYTPEVLDINGAKTWNDAADQDGIRPNSITVNLFADGEFIDAAEVTAANDWNYSFTNLPKYEAGEEIVYTITEDAVEKYEAAVDGYNITNSYTPEVTEVTGTKTWEDANNQDAIRPESITVNLLADGEAVDSIEVTEADEWAYSFTNLPKYKAGVEIVYTVTENTVADYTHSIDGFDITNAYTPGQTAVTVTKHWNDANNQDGIRPESIEVQLTANGEAYGEPIVLSDANSWTYTWSELDEKAAGKTIVYSVIELTELPKYETEVNDKDHGNIIITNAYTPEVTEVSGVKAWDDADNQDGIRPDSITVNLLADGEHVQSIVVTKADDWAYSFTDLPKYKAGIEIVYTVTENTVEGYTVEIDGYDITNHYTPGETWVTVTKNWLDANNQDGRRPDSIEVQLIADGETYGDPVKLSEENNWTHTWAELAEKAAGETIVYTVIEITEVPGYDTSINDANHGNIVITNSYTPKVTEVSGIKTWNDAADQDGIRPDSITVNLFANDEFVTSIAVTATVNWSYSFTDLPKYQAGEEIDYTVTEDAVEGYETTIDGFDITNAYTPEVIDINGAKTWEDANNQDGVRPASITVNLLANGEVVDSVEVTEADDWKYSFKALPKYEAGEEIVYTVTENTVVNYTTEVNGHDIINHYTPEETSVTVTKHWNDGNNQDSKRPESIEVQLTANGELYGDSVVLSSKNNWTHTWEGLAEKAAGEAIVYSAIEITEVPEYETTVNDANHGNIIITNTYKPELVDISGTKSWVDADNKSGNRPDTITVNLLAGGLIIESVKVTEAADWNYSFRDLPKYKAGEEIEYTITENAVEGYETAINGYDITNTLIEEEENPTGTDLDTEDPEKPSAKDEEDKATIAAGGKKEEKHGNKLPSTATNMFNMLAIGLVILVLGIALAVYRRRKEVN